MYIKNHKVETDNILDHSNELFTRLKNSKNSKNNYG